MSIAISHQLGNRCPVVVQTAKIVHHPSVLVHTGAKTFDSLGIIDLAVQVDGYGAGEPIEIGIVHVGDALVLSKPANGLPSNRP